MTVAEADETAERHQPLSTCWVWIVNVEEMKRIRSALRRRRRRRRGLPLPLRGQYHWRFVWPSDSVLVAARVGDDLLATLAFRTSRADDVRAVDRVYVRARDREEPREEGVRGSDMCFDVQFDAQLDCEVRLHGKYPKRNLARLLRSDVVAALPALQELAMQPPDDSD